MMSQAKALAMQQLHALIPELRAHSLPDIKPALAAAESVYLLGASSFLGRAYRGWLTRFFKEQGKQVIFVDDTLRESPIAGCALIDSDRFSGQQEGVAISLPDTAFAAQLFARKATRSGVQLLSLIQVVDAFGLPAIYQLPSVMRQATLARLDDYLEFAQRLDDTLSIQTLAAFLKLRVTMERSSVLPVVCSLEDEYFSKFPAGKSTTFALSENEIFCDVGAYTGDTVRRFLAATNWEYERIYAFEPDAGNFSTMQQGLFKELTGFHPRKMALSHAPGMLSFAETSGMGSRVDAGGVQVQASTLDDEVPHATFIKMDVEGHETSVLRGARRLISQSKPRMAITGYHYADDLLDIAKLVLEIEPGYRFRLRHHSFYYYDTILYVDMPS
jgi:FkbM family methyltransferase